jgi:hypothetical protein
MSVEFLAKRLQLDIKTVKEMFGNIKPNMSKKQQRRLVEDVMNNDKSVSKLIESNIEKKHAYLNISNRSLI